jgi:hypothetical protein
MTPDSMKVHLTKLEKMNEYSMQRPVTGVPVRSVDDFGIIKQVLESADFKSTYGERAKKVISGNGFFIATDDVARAAKEQREVLAALVGTPEDADKVAAYFYRKTKEVLADNSFTLVGGKTKGADIVRDVLRFVPLHWASCELAGIQLKTSKHPDGEYTPLELYEMLGEIYSYLFIETHTAKLKVLEKRVKGHVENLLEQITDNLGASGGNRLSILGIYDTLSSIFTKPKKGSRQEVLNKLYQIGGSSDQLANTILAIMVGLTVELSLALTNAVNLYLDATTPEIKSLALPGQKTNLDGLVFEAMRLDPAFQGVYRTSTKAQNVSGMTLREGEKIFLNIAANSKNEKVYPNASAVNTSRPVDNYLVADGAHKCLGDALTTKIKGEVLRAIFELPGVRRAPGQSGRLNRFPDSSDLMLRNSYLDSTQFAVPWPTSLSILYDVKN